MNSNDNQYFIRIRSTGERIPATKDEFDTYYRDINAFRTKKPRGAMMSFPLNANLRKQRDVPLNVSLPISPSGTNR